MQNYGWTNIICIRFVFSIELFFLKPHKPTGFLIFRTNSVHWDVYLHMFSAPVGACLNSHTNSCHIFQFNPCRNSVQVPLKQWQMWCWGMWGTGVVLKTWNLGLNRWKMYCLFEKINVLLWRDPFKNDFNRFKDIFFT